MTPFLQHDEMYAWCSCMHVMWLVVRCCADVCHRVGLGMNEGVAGGINNAASYLEGQLHVVTKKLLPGCAATMACVPLY